MYERDGNALERRVLYESILAIQNSRNPRVRHQKPRKWEIKELSGLSDNAIKTAARFLETWMILHRSRTGWEVRPLPHLFCWSHGIDVKRRPEIECRVCYQRFLALADRVYTHRLQSRGATT